MTRFVSKERLKEIVAKRDELGCSWKEAIHHYGHDYENTKRNLKKAGMWEKREVVTLTQEQIDAVLELNDGVLTARQIATQVGAPLKSVAYHLTKANRTKREPKQDIGGDWLRRPLL